jgi:hypothetical protein
MALERHYEGLLEKLTVIEHSQLFFDPSRREPMFIHFPQT